MRTIAILSLGLIFLNGNLMNAESLCFSIQDKAGISLDDASVNVIRLNDSSRLTEMLPSKGAPASRHCFDVTAGSLVRATISRKGFIAITYENILVREGRGRSFSVQLEFLNWTEESFGVK